ncbi:MAG TPA: patatin-like phospholipase family protein [Nevskiaceae bacterium]|nr:patatin-like phospholipase family protein [Nevskiaceae bacterium]
MAGTTDKQCDLVLEGGGVKGIGLVGAVQVLAEKGYQFQRVAGTSAGAIVGSLVAAGMSPEQMATTMKQIDYKAFRDEGLLDKLGLPGKMASLVFEKGIYEGNYLRNWLAQQLEALGVRTFADLRLEEPWAKDLPPQQRYKLMVVVSDISRGRLVRLPWDYHVYGLDPDTQLVADAVRASMSIPFFFEPVQLAGRYLVDGGVLSNFPVDSFDNTAQWPTFGIKLSAKEDANTDANPVSSPIDFVQAIVSTAMSAHDQMHLDDPCTNMRTIFVDTMRIKGTDFDIKPAQQQQLYENGRKYALTFLNTWSFADYKKVCPIK